MSVCVIFLLEFEAPSDSKFPDRTQDLGSRHCGQDINFTAEVHNKHQKVQWLCSV